MIKNSFYLIKRLLNKGVLHYYVGSYLEKIFDYGSQFILTFFLLPIDLGRIKYVLTINEILIALIGLGIPLTMLNLGGSIKEKNEPSYTSNAVFIILTTGIVVVGLALVVFGFDFLRIENGTWDFMLLLFPISLLWTLSRLFISILQAKRNFKEISYSQVISKLISIPVLLMLVYLFHVEGYILGLYVGAIFTLIIVLFFWQKIDVFKFQLLSWSTSINLIRKSGYAFLAQIISILAMYLNYFVLSFSSVSAEDFGYYSFALIIIQGLQLFITTTQNYVIPQFNGNNLKDRDIRLKTKNLERKLYVFVLFMGFGAFVFVKFILFRFLPSYIGAQLVLFLLLFVWIIRSLPTVKGAIFIGTGNLRVNFYNNLTSFAVLVPISIISIFWFGIYGAILSSLIQGVLNNFIISNSFKKIFSND